MALPGRPDAARARSRDGNVLFDANGEHARRCLNARRRLAQVCALLLPNMVFERLTGRFIARDPTDSGRKA
jgi:hypothetical protein